MHTLRLSSLPLQQHDERLGLLPQALLKNEKRGMRRKEERKRKEFLFFVSHFINVINGMLLTQFKRFLEIAWVRNQIQPIWFGIDSFIQNKAIQAMTKFCVHQSGTRMGEEVL